MSSQKTERYQLHRWTQGDAFLREEMNENFTKVDTALAQGCKIMIGSYQGTGGGQGVTQDIVLGQKPKAVVIAGERQSDSNQYQPAVGILADGHSSDSFGTILPNGFRVVHKMNGSGGVYPDLNGGQKYCYIAFF